MAVSLHILEANPDHIAGCLPEATEDAIRTVVIGQCAGVGLNSIGSGFFDDHKMTVRVRWTSKSDPDQEEADDKFSGVTVQISVRLDRTVSLYGGAAAAIPCFKSAVAEGLQISEDDIAVWTKDFHVVAECEVRP